MNRNILRWCHGWYEAVSEIVVGKLSRLTPSIQCCVFCAFYAFANIYRRLEWKNFEVVVSTSKLINVSNVMNNAKEKLDFRDRIIKTSIGFKHMIVATSSQCYVYRLLSRSFPLKTALGTT